ncbi:MAG: hypothetical protein HC836_35720 [Richelia sp. RM2_1_2]|nr:hypothetical protein [Richelia sp. RM1_1_1]NJO63374.1 hypothetical protein [Richelia sp. RM2_1_2]
MKVFFRYSIVILVSFIGLTFILEQIFGYQVGLVQAQNISKQDLPVPVALPTLADVYLKGGESKTGRITAIDLRSKKLTIQRDGSSPALEPINKIEKVRFREDAPVYNSNGKLVIRGGSQGLTAKKPEIWSGILLTDFKLQNPRKGQGFVKLGSVFNRKRLQGIRSVAGTCLYVAEELKFEPSTKITFQVRATCER